MKTSVMPLCARPLIAGFFIVFLITFFTARSSAQCIASSVRNATSAVNDNSIGALAFTNPSNGTNSDNNRASANALASLLSGNTYYLKASGFGFAIPSYASICGVVVEIEKSAGGIGVLAWVRDHDVRLVKEGVVAGNNLGNLGTNWSGTDAYHTYGGPSNLWGTTLTPEDVNAPGFGAAISAAFEGVAILLPSARIDNIRITVYYNPILPTRLVSFNTTVKNNTARLNWITADEEEGESITVQRSVNQSSWTDIARFNMHNSRSGRAYNYEDVLPAKGNYTYRLRIENNNGTVTYSDMRVVKYNGQQPVEVWPNPAKDFIIIGQASGVQSVTVTGVSLQRFTLPAVPAEGGIRVDVSRLPPGIYVASTGMEQVKFLKQ